MEFFWCLAVLAHAPAARASPMVDALRAHDWTTAANLAAQTADPLAGKLVTFIRLLQAGQASTVEIDRFLTENPDWPDQKPLNRRLEEALAQEADPAAAQRICAARRVEAIPALLHCADIAGHPKGAAYARKAWILGVTDISDQTAFLQRWSDVLTPEDDWLRFDRLAWADDHAAAAQEVRLDGEHVAAAAARLALRHNESLALTLLDRVPERLRTDPTMILEEARYLRRTEADAAAVALWHAAGLAAETDAPEPRRAAFWAERDTLTRKLLAANNASDARDIATDQAATGDQVPETLFLSGWIALRRQHDVAGALAKFAALGRATHAAISLSRANYWRARAEAESGDTAKAHASNVEAAAFTTTFYGQLAAGALNMEKTLGEDPAWTSSQEAAFSRSELIRAANILAGWDDRPRARNFVLASVLSATDAGLFALAAHTADALGIPETGVQIARLAGRQGFMLPQAGWPMPFHPVGEAAPLVLGVMRQESSFDPAAVSPAGAIGLMQLRPSTARDIEQHVAQHGTNLFDAIANTRLGTAYLDKLLAQFDGAIPVALAAYNAGPHRVGLWEESDPAPATVLEMIDWIEMIPFGETRNYVQRVMENASNYAVKSHVSFDAFANLAR